MYSLLYYYYTELDQLLPACTTDCDSESSKHDVPTPVAKSSNQLPPPYEEGMIKSIHCCTKLRRSMCTLTDYYCYSIILVCVHIVLN